MTWIALVGPEIEENLSLRYLASSLSAAGYASEIVPFCGERQFDAALRAILDAAEPPLLVGLSLAFQWKATDTLALALALREGGYAGHVTPNMRPPGARWDTSGIVVAVQLPGPGFGTNGNTIQSVSVDPTTIKATVSSASEPGMLLLQPNFPATWPVGVTLDIAVQCMGDNGMLLSHVRVHLDTSQPALSGDVPVSVLPSGADAGT
jgi:hypothetical protein